ncbi:putative fungistatic metabolite isoform X1 [Haliotis rufescens]|uniref:putative fungistatic metabolite isoform X1 n=1 Tax=Haliotis rufescens TaxID=6454 RepID=UPI001EB056AE|nr:putative fungistatic metabolite isoform X1 [Haliotis rufescens]XP_048251472.1 putative fungistatic metabolite isoform X1 [Haliotis rufescens]
MLSLLSPANMFVFTLLAMFSVAWTFKTFDVATFNEDKITAVEDTVHRLVARVKALEALEAYINISGKAEASMTSLAERVNALELEVQNMRSMETVRGNRSSTKDTLGAAVTKPHPVKYVGCYRDSWVRALHFLCPTTHLTTEKCRMCCLDHNFSYFGTEVGLQCFCGDDIHSGNKKVDDTECASPCAGDVQDRCGGNWAISIYQM